MFEVEKQFQHFLLGFFFNPESQTFFYSLELLMRGEHFSDLRAPECGWT